MSAHGLQEEESPAAIRRLLSRKDLAAMRHRSALAEMLGMTETEALAIAHLAQHGELTPTSLGRLTHLSSAGTTAVVQRLERTNFAERAPHPRDGRSTVLRLTPAGVDKVARAMRPLVEDIDRILSALEPEARRMVAHVLEAVAEASERHAAQLHDEADAAAAAAATPRSVPGLWA